MDDSVDMRSGCRVRSSTSGRRPLGSSSWLLKVPIYALKTKGNEQQFSFTCKVAKTRRAAWKALESGVIPKAKEEPNIGISLITTRQKIIKLADKSEFGWATVKSTFLMNCPTTRLTPGIFFLGFTSMK